MATHRARAKPKKASKAKPRRAKAAGGASKKAAANAELVQAGLHDLTNLATAIRAYLELLTSQSQLEAKQKYYVDRAREQVEMMVDLVRELREKMA